MNLNLTPVALRRNPAANPSLSKSTRSSISSLSGLLLLLSILFPTAVYAQGLDSDDINNAIVLSGSLPLEWTNDATYPWTLSGSNLRCGNSGVKNSASTVGFKYTSEYPATVTFNYTSTGSSTENLLQVKIDGSVKNSYSNVTGGSYKVRLPKGEHTVEFRDTVYNTNATFYSQISSVKVAEGTPNPTDAEINAAILAEGSIQPAWFHDPRHHWYVADNKLISGNYGFVNTSSEVSFKFSSEVPATVSFKLDFQSNSSYSYPMYTLDLKVDGNQHCRFSGSGGTTPVKLRVPKGEHTITLRYNNSNANGYYISGNYEGKLHSLSINEFTDVSVTSDEINSIIVLEGSELMTWENDEVFPWTIQEGKLLSGNRGYDFSTSSVSLKTSSDKISTLTFKYDVDGASGFPNQLLVYVDDVLTLKENNSYSKTAQTYTLKIPVGEHIVKFSNDTQNPSSVKSSSIYDVSLTEIPLSSIEEINEAVVLEGSIPLTWIQDSNFPWTIEEGRLKSNNDGIVDTLSDISFKYSAEYPTEVSFKHKNNYNGSSQHFIVLVDGVAKYNTSGSYDEVSRSFWLPQGDHVITFRSLLDSSANPYRSSVWDICVRRYGASEEEINKAIVLDGSIPLTWVQDETYPWTIQNGKLKSSIDGLINTPSRISFQYTCENPTTVEFKYQNSSTNLGEYIFVFVDGVENGYIRGNGGTVYSKVLRLPKGSHCVTFMAYYENLNSTYKSSVYGVRVIETVGVSDDELNSNFVIRTPVEISWDCDELPLQYIDGELTSTNAMWANSNSTLIATFELDEPAIIDFDWRVGASQSEHLANFYVDGISMYKTSSSTQWSTISLALSPGKHTVKWRYAVTTTGADYKLQLKNLSVKYEEVEIETTPGLLGLQALMHFDKLADVRLLKIKGTLNSTDWANVKLMTNLCGLDLSETSLTTIPAGFNANSGFSYIVLPSQLETIPDKAFTTCMIQTIEIPASVKTIGNEAFSGTKLRDLTFAEGSQLETIGYKAFYDTYLRGEFVMPNTVKTLSTYYNSTDKLYRSEAFSKTPVTKIIFSDNLTTLPRYTCDDCYNLKEIVFPKDIVEIPDYFMTCPGFGTITKLESVVIPESVKRIGDYSFQGIASLKYVSLPKELNSIGRYAFQSTAIEQIDLPENLKTINAGAFAGAKLKHIDFPESLTTIGSSAFHLCSLDTVILSDKLTSLGSYAFENNENLKAVRLPSGIGTYSGQFSGCPNIQTVECQSALPPTITSDPFPAVTKTNVNLNVPSFSVSKYKLDSYWMQFGKIDAGSAADYYRIDGNLAILNSRRIEGKPDVDLVGGKLTVIGENPMALGKFDFYASDSSISAFYADNPSVTVDELNVHFTVDANKWYFITPPADIDLDKVTVSSTENYVFRYFDGAARAANGKGSSWKNVTDTKLRAGQGYIFQCDTAGEILFPVPADATPKLLAPGSTDVTLAAHDCESTANKGWNFIGNPLLSYYDIKYLDFSGPITVWTGSTYKAYSITDDTLWLYPMRGFFVQKPDAADALTLDPLGRFADSTLRRLPARKGTPSARSLFNLAVTTAPSSESSEFSLSDEARVVINPDASLGYEMSRDAAKFMSFEEGVPQIYTVDADGNRLAINERPALTAGGLSGETLPAGSGAAASAEVRLGLYIPDGTAAYTISATRADGEAWLLDAETGATHDLASADYTFVASQGYVDDRFTLLLAPARSTGSSSGSDSGSSDNSDPFGSTGVGSYADDVLVDVHTVTGILLRAGVRAADALTDLPAGIYLVAGKKVVRL